MSIITRTCVLHESPLVRQDAKLQPIGPAATVLLLQGLYESYVSNVDTHKLDVALREVRAQHHPGGVQLIGVSGHIDLTQGLSTLQVWFHTEAWPKVIAADLARRQAADIIASILDQHPTGHWPSGWRELILHAD